MNISRTAASHGIWDGHDARTLARQLNVPALAVHGEVESTQDIAHALAEQGALSGTVVLADSQTAGRGRLGRSWSSQPGRGVWCTVIERPTDARAIDVLSVRVGLHIAEALDRFAGSRVSLKWPNDLTLRGAKLGGILAEARWSGATPSWVAIGVGVNVLPPDIAGAVGLAPGVQRVEVLAGTVAAVRSAAVAPGWLSLAEIERYHARDALVGRRIVSPAEGEVTGIAASGALIVKTAAGLQQHRAGTITFAEGL